MVPLRCALQYLLRERVRTALILAGLMSAFAASAFIYGVAGHMTYNASHSLRWVVGNADLWIIPASGVELDASTAAITAPGHLPPDLATVLQRHDPDATVRLVQVSKIATPDGPLVCYTLAEPGLLRRNACSADVWARHGAQPFEVACPSVRLVVEGVDETLPPRSIANFGNEIQGPPSWITVTTSHPERWLRLPADFPVAVRDTPHLDDRSKNDPRPVMMSLTRSRTRFNPYSFDTRFAALVMNRSLNARLGTFARLVLALGCVIAVSSSLFGLREKSTLIAVLAAEGITGQIVVILLFESAILVGSAWLLGSLAAFAILDVAVFPNAEPASLLQGIALSAVFVPATVLAATLVSVARLLNVEPARLVKRAFA